MIIADYLFVSSDNLLDPRHEVPDTGVNSRSSVPTKLGSEGDDTEKVDGLQVVVRRSGTGTGDSLEIQRPTRVTL